MPRPRSPQIRSLLSVIGALSILQLIGTAQAQETPGSDRDEIVHVLNRITFGPRPGDVEAVQKMGLRNYIEQQLHPETINDSAVEQQLAGFDLLQMSGEQLTTMYFDERKNAIEKQHEIAVRAAIAAGEVPPKDPPLVSTGDVTMQAPTQGPAQPGALADAVKKAGKHGSYMAVGELQQAKLVRAVDSERQLQEVLVDFWTNHFNIDMHKGPDRVLKVVDDRDVIRPHILGKFRDLLEASAKSPAMLFYLDNASSTLGHIVTPLEHERAEAQHERSVAAGQAAGFRPIPKVGEKIGGVNENYGREIMELHTLGVDTGYTQQDVQEVARCFTGWSFERTTGEFTFREKAHDNGAKVVLGHQIPAGGGIQDGETVLDILASSPATAHHISYELCQRFVSDTPPASLVDRVAGVFTQTGGDLRKVTEAILTSPEFLSPTEYNKKIKSPLEFAVSAVRASGSTIVAQPGPPYNKILPTMEGAASLGAGQAAERLSKLPRQSLNEHIVNLGEPLFGCAPPTGYKEVSTVWVSPGALIERLNFAMALTEQRVRDVRFNPQTILAGSDLDQPEAVLNQSVAVLLQNNISPSTRKVLEQSALPAQSESKTVNPSKLIALIIGSPEFQRK